MQAQENCYVLEREVRHGCVACGILELTERGEVEIGDSYRLPERALHEAKMGLYREVRTVAL